MSRTLRVCQASQLAIKLSVKKCTFPVKLSPRAWALLRILTGHRCFFFGNNHYFQKSNSEKLIPVIKSRRWRRAQSFFDYIKCTESVCTIYVVTVCFHSEPHAEHSELMLRKIICGPEFVNGRVVSRCDARHMIGAYFCQDVCVCVCVSVSVCV